MAGEYVIAPYSSGELYAMRVTNGRVAWSDTLTRTGGVTALSELDDIAGRPVIDRDMVFAISHSGVMAAINLNTGDRVWTRDIGGIQTPWAAGDFVYVLTTDNQLLCLQRKDGRVKWIHQMPRWEDPEDKDSTITWSGPVLVSNRLILVSSNGYAHSVSPYTGQLLGRVEIPDGTDDRACRRRPDPLPSDRRRRTRGDAIERRPAVGSSPRESPLCHSLLPIAACPLAISTNAH